MPKKSAVVTGGSGFIGAHLVRRLLTDGWNVSAVVRYASVLKNQRLAAIWDQLSIIEADIRNRGALEAGLHALEPDAVFHLAAYNHVGHSFQQVEECFDVNGKGTANLVDACAGARRIVYMSTSEVYGHQEAVPFVETMYPQPQSPYATTKYAGELYVRLKQRIEPSRFVIVRAFNTFGPGQSTGAVVAELILAFLRGEPVRTTRGEQTREFNYVEDIVDGLVRAALHSGPIEGPINLAGGREVAIRDLVSLIAARTGSAVRPDIGALPYRPNEIWRMFADASRARKELGWEPRIGLEEGLSRTVDWFRRWLADPGVSLP